jgi:hypothetical protein
VSLMLQYLILQCKKQRNSTTSHITAMIVTFGSRFQLFGGFASLFDRLLTLIKIVYLEHSHVDYSILPHIKNINVKIIR